MGNKQEKAMRKAWKKKANALANQDLDGLIRANKDMALINGRLRNQKLSLAILCAVQLVAIVVVAIL